MASERIHNEYDATRIANAVDTLAENLAGYTPESPVNPTDAMKAKLPSQSTGDRIANAVESLAQNFNGSNTVVADTEVSPAENTHDIGTYLTYNGKEYVVLKYIDIDDPLDYESGDPNIEEVSLPDGTYIVTDDGDGEGGGGSSSADDVSYDNTASGLTADNVQNAIDEVNARIEGLGASDITFDNTDTGMTADDVQEAIGELNSNKKGRYVLIASIDSGTSSTATYSGYTELLLMARANGSSNCKFSALYPIIEGRALAGLNLYLQDPTNSSNGAVVSFTNATTMSINAASLTGYKFEVLGR